MVGISTGIKADSLPISSSPAFELEKETLKMKTATTLIIFALFVFGYAKADGQYHYVGAYGK